MRRFWFAVLLCCCALPCRGQEHGEEEGGGAEVLVTGQQACDKSLAELERAVAEVLGDNDLDNVTINCAAYGASGVLEKAIISAFVVSSNASGLRYEFVCSKQSVLIGLPLELEPSADAPDGACVACDSDNDASCVASEKLGGGRRVHVFILV